MRKPLVSCPAASLASRHSHKVYISAGHSAVDSTSGSSPYPGQQEFYDALNKTHPSASKVSFTKSSHTSKVFISKEHNTHAHDLDTPSPNTFNPQYTSIKPRSPTIMFSGSSPSNQFLSRLHSEATGPQKNPSPADYEIDPAKHRSKPINMSPKYSLGLRHSHKCFISAAHSEKTANTETPSAYSRHSVWVKNEKIRSKIPGASFKGHSSPKMFISNQHCSVNLCRETLGCAPSKLVSDTAKGSSFSFGKEKRLETPKLFYGNDYMTLGRESGKLGPGSFNVSSEMGKAGIQAKLFNEKKLVGKERKRVKSGI
ncbi:hypothetical protein GEMRC1_002034 [Eukaryota sp. GEM-RC1]